MVFPVVIDSRPAFAGKRMAPASLLLTPLGSGTVLSHVRSFLTALTRGAPRILTTFEPEVAYKNAVREACPELDSVLTPTTLAAQLSTYEASDWLLLVDPSCFPAAGLEPALLFGGPEDDPRWVRHLVALEPDAGRTREYVESDLDGRVRRILRYYNPVTWPFAAGVSCSLLPMSCALLARDLPFEALPQLRKALASLGVPSHDVPLPGGGINLKEEQGLLALNERVVLDLAASLKQRQAAGGSAVVGSRCRIHPSARLLGPVVVQDDVEIHEGAIVVGPATIGADSRVGPYAVVAQCLLARNSRIAADAMVRHRFVCGDSAITPVQATPSIGPARVPSALDGRNAAPFGLTFEQRRRSFYPHLKRPVEAVIALLGLIALSPLLLLLGVLIKLGSRGSILYGDEREGKNGRPFRCWKLRTMVEGANALQRELQARNQVDGPQFKIERDPRLTRLGALLRMTCLDELPQLINVVRGEMSLVGPRPSPFRENQTCVPWREARLSLRPGITGLWQVCRHQRSNGDFHQWIYYDLLYVRYQSLWLDMKILAATVITLGGKRPFPLSWLIPPNKYYERRSSRRELDGLDQRALRLRA